MFEKVTEEVDFGRSEFYLTYKAVFYENAGGATLEIVRDGSRTATASKMERFVIIINGFQPLLFITKCSILDAAAVLDPLLIV